MTKAHTIRNAALCVAIYLACLLIAWPVAEMGFVDDWSYIKTAQVFAQTGHLTYNGWAAPLQGWQAVWGALFIRLFGFSFMAVKLSMLPIAAATIGLFCLLLQKIGVNGRNAVVGTLTLSLSPFFLPLSASFMTDIPGLLPVIACLLFFVNAVQAKSGRDAAQWLVVATLSSLIGGTARQLAWLGALAMLPAVTWFLRGRRYLFAVGIGSWILSIGFVALCLEWQEAQPLGVTHDLWNRSGISPVGQTVLTIYQIGGGVIGLMIASIPLLLPWLAQWRKISRITLRIFTIALFVVALMQLAGFRDLPWIPHLIASQFSSTRIAANHTDLDHLLLPKSVGLVLLLVLSAASLPVLARMLEWLISRSKRQDKNTQSLDAALPAMCTAYVVAYCVLLLPRAIHGQMLDRYMIGLEPIAILILVKLYQNTIEPRLPTASIALLALMALLGIAGTHDWFAWQRARLAAIAELTSAGIPRTSFYGGIEYDGWTQIEHGGYINNPWLKNPPGAYKPQPEVSKDDPCGYDFAPYVPSIHAEYTIVFEPKPCFEPAPFAPVTYTSWIPPFRRTIYVQRIPARQQEPAR